MSRHHRTGRRGGFSLAELVIVSAVFGIVIAGALGFMTSQSRAFDQGSDRLLVLQNLRYAYQALEIDVATLGSNVPDGQPGLVLAGDDVIAFTADYTSNTLNDFSAVFIDPDAPDEAVQAPRSPVSLPSSSYSWPDTVYDALGGAPSPAELIIFFFVSDTSTSRTDDYVLMRQVNDEAPEVLSRDLLRQGSTPFFRYFNRRMEEGGASELDSIPDDDLPLFHFAKVHGASDDVGNSAKADSIRAVRVSFRSTNGRTGDAERFADVSRVLDVPNAGLGIVGTCGDAPFLSSTLTVAQVVGAERPTVRISWPPSVDEQYGEADVVRYVIYRRSWPHDGTWGDPYLSIPAGETSYTYDDADVDEDVTYQYAHAAQDCTPSLSPLSMAQQVSVF
jgi:prepilin-type N-terminal cleavage/methylation domain-containing protein